MDSGDRLAGLFPGLTRDHPAHGTHQLLSLVVGIGRAVMPADQAVTDVAACSAIVWTVCSRISRSPRAMKEG